MSIGMAIIVSTIVVTVGVVFCWCYFWYIGYLTMKEKK